MARAAARKTAAKARDALGTAQKDSDEDEVMEESGDEKRLCVAHVRAPRKKQAKPSRANTGKRNAQTGAMSGFMRLPLETVTQICESLDLKTLFHLSTLNKRFFRFLHDESLSHLWEDARKTSELPDLEVPMPPHQLAHLLFGSHCSVCGKSTTVVNYFLRIRACKACSSKVLTTDVEADTRYECAKLVPQSSRDSFGRKRGKPLQRVDELKHVNSHFQTYDAVRAKASKKQKWFVWEDGPSVGFSCDHPLCEGMGEVTWTSMREHFNEMRRARTKDGQALLDWQLAQAAQVQAERDGVVEKRRQDIAGRFKALGWRPHYFDKPDFCRHPLVAVVEELDEATWTKIRGPLEESLKVTRDAEDAALLQETRSARTADRKKEFCQLATNKAELKTLGLYPVPRWDEFMELETVESLLSVDTVEAAYETAPTIADSAEAIAAELVLRRTASKLELFDKLLVQLRATESTLPIPSGAGKTGVLAGSEDPTSALMLPVAAGAGDTYSDEQVDDIMSRAYSIFKCDTCNMIDHFPRILGHPCQTYRYGVKQDEAHRPSFKAVSYSINSSTILAVIAMVDKAGLPRSVKISTVDDLGATFSCLCWNAKLKHTVHPYYTHEDLTSTVVHETLQESKDRVFAKHLEAVEKGFGERGDAV
ncbi:hypothetical protein NBRC10513_002884 [Rhodotorula toruloides]